MNDELPADDAQNDREFARIASQGNAEYTPEDLQHLSDMEHVRKRPAMYIGDVTSRGLHHLVYEVVDNSIDEAMAGFAQNISVTVNMDGSVTVEDDGRGIPVENHEQLSQELGRDVSTLEGVMTVLKFGGKFEKGAYQASGGLHGVGVTVVNFLSQWCEVDVSARDTSTTRNMNRVFLRALYNESEKVRRLARRPHSNLMGVSFKQQNTALIFSVSACRNWPS
jgi:DNA gyrase subunit B